MWNFSDRRQAQAFELAYCGRSPARPEDTGLLELALALSAVALPTPDGRAGRARLAGFVRTQKEHMGKPGLSGATRGVAISAAALGGAGLLVAGAVSDRNPVDILQDAIGRVPIIVGSVDGSAGLDAGGDASLSTQGAAIGGHANAAMLTTAEVSTGPGDGTPNADLGAAVEGRTTIGADQVAVGMDHRASIDVGTDPVSETEATISVGTSASPGVAVTVDAAVGLNASGKVAADTGDTSGDGLVPVITSAGEADLEAGASAGDGAGATVEITSDGTAESVPGALEGSLELEFEAEGSLGLR